MVGGPVFGRIEYTAGNGGEPHYYLLTHVLVAIYAPEDDDNH